MLSATEAPATGVDFVRLDLATTIRGFETLRDAGAHTQRLSPEQSYWFNRYLAAWEYYRPSQPQAYQDQVEGIVAAIFGYRISL